MVLCLQDSWLIIYADPTIFARTQCTSAEQLQIELDKLADVLTLEEGEDTWEKLERAVIRFAGITRGGGYKFTGVFMEGVGKKGTGLRLVQCVRV